MNPDTAFLLDLIAYGEHVAFALGFIGVASFALMAYNHIKHV